MTPLKPCSFDHLLNVHWCFVAGKRTYTLERLLEGRMMSDGMFVERGMLKYYVLVLYKYKYLSTVKRQKIRVYSTNYSCVLISFHNNIE